MDIGDLEVPLGHSMVFATFVLLGGFVLADFSAGFYPASGESNRVANMLLELFIAANLEAPALRGFEHVSALVVRP